MNRMCPCSTSDGHYNTLVWRADLDMQLPTSLLKVGLTNDWHGWQTNSPSQPKQPTAVPHRPKVIPKDGCNVPQTSGKEVPLNYLRLDATNTLSASSISKASSKLF
jgi:hypothetical protein